MFQQMDENDQQDTMQGASLVSIKEGKGQELACDMGHGDPVKEENSGSDDFSVDN